MADAKLRHAIAFEAARIMYDRTESEYCSVETSRFDAVKFQRIRRFGPVEFPSNLHGFNRAMSSVNWHEVRDALTQLSDHELQLRLWLSDGFGGSDVSSFAEAVEQLFTDTGLSCKLEDNGSGLGAEVDELFRLMEQEILKVNTQSGPLHTINNPAMANVRSIAIRLLSKIRMGSRA